MGVSRIVKRGWRYESYRLAADDMPQYRRPEPARQRSAGDPMLIERRNHMIYNSRVVARRPLVSDKAYIKNR